jgi:hypothetical protein
MVKWKNISTTFMATAFSKHTRKTYMQKQVGDHFRRFQEGFFITCYELPMTKIIGH